VSPAKWRAVVSGLPVGSRLEMPAGMSQFGELEPLPSIYELFIEKWECVDQFRADFVRRMFPRLKLVPITGSNTVKPDIEHPGFYISTDPPEGVINRGGTFISNLGWRKKSIT
jgi:hypothetical protein